MLNNKEQGTVGIQSKFRQQVIANAVRVLSCPICLDATKAAAWLGLPQPGWVGQRYRPNRGVVFILQNPGPMKPEGLVQSIESRFQTLFKQLAREKTFTIYDELVAFALLQMRGWPKWNFPLSPCVPGLEMTQIAWLNAAKVRGHTLPTSLLRHTAHDHLISEITALKPGAVIAVGRKAASALDLMPSELLQRCKFVGFVKEQGASYVEVNAIATSLRALGLCR